METYRLKRIVIVLLALVNLFLLGLLLNFRWQGSRSRQALSQALAELYADNQIQLPQGLDASAASLTPMGVTRSEQEEAAFAQALVGEDARAKAAASGIPQAAGRMVKSWSFCIGKPSFFLAYLPGRRLLQGFLRSSIMKMDPENSVSAFGSTTV